MEKSEKKWQWKKSGMSGKSGKKLKNDKRQKYKNLPLFVMRHATFCHVVHFNPWFSKMEKLAGVKKLPPPVSMAIYVKCMTAPLHKSAILGRKLAC